MFRDVKVAAQVSALMLEIGACMDVSVATVRENCSEEEFRRYRRATGAVLAELLEIMNSIYAEHPALKPSQME